MAPFSTTALLISPSHPMSRLVYVVVAVLVLAACAETEVENPDFPKCNPSDENACNGHGSCMETGECECHATPELGVYTGIDCQCGGSESECTSDEKAGCHWCSTVEPAVCVISEEVCHALSLNMIDTESETGDGESSEQSTYSSVSEGTASVATSNSMYFFIGSVLAIGAFAWYFKLRGVRAPIEDDIPAMRQRTSASAFEMHGDGL
jgi:hypothetical protein